MAEPGDKSSVPCFSVVSRAAPPLADAREAALRAAKRIGGAREVELLTAGAVNFALEMWEFAAEPQHPLREAVARVRARIRGTAWAAASAVLRWPHFA